MHCSALSLPQNFNRKPKTNLKMKILHYRTTDYVEEPWKDALITSQQQVEGFRSKTIVSINGQTVIRQHASTYITGKDTCLAHHFAKMIAAAVLTGKYDRAPRLTVTPADDRPARVLWIDSVRGIHLCADFFNEMITHFDPDHTRFSLLCLDKMGQFRYDFYGQLAYIEKAIQNVKPTLLVIDDIDHLMPNCGINAASAFNHAIRDTLNHTDTACLFIGYNHLGKKAGTTGNLGKLLFPEASNIFSVTTQQAISKVRLVKSFNYQVSNDSEFLFTVNSDNMACEVVRTMPVPESISMDGTFLRESTLRDIISEVVKPGETISPDQLYTQLNNRRLHLNRCDRTRKLIAQATELGIIRKIDDTSNAYTLTAPTPCDTDQNDPSVNNSLTFPRPSSPSSPSLPSPPLNPSSP